MLDARLSNPGPAECHRTTGLRDALVVVGVTLRAQNPRTGWIGRCVMLTAWEMSSSGI
jgi:hypothetical protein